MRSLSFVLAASLLACAPPSESEAACEDAATGELVSCTETDEAELAKPRWPGHVPGKIHLGFSSTTFDAKLSELGQPVSTHRQFSGWGEWASVGRDIENDLKAGRLAWVSIKPPSNGAAGWRAVGNGSKDAELKALATVLKSVTGPGKNALLTFHHESSNDGTEAEGALWAQAYSHMHDVLRAEGALAYVADPPILGDWLFNAQNRNQAPENWVTKDVLDRAPFLGIDLYENPKGDTFAARLGFIIEWMASRGYPYKMVGIGEMGCTDAAYPKLTAVNCMKESFDWAAANPRKIGVISYFSSAVNSRDGVYWPLDESAAKRQTFKSYLDQPVFLP